MENLNSIVIGYYDSFKYVVSWCVMGVILGLRIHSMIKYKKLLQIVKGKEE